MPVEVEYARCSLMDRLRQVCRRICRIARRTFTQEGATDPKRQVRRYRDQLLPAGRIVPDVGRHDRGGRRNPTRKAMTCWLALVGRRPEQR